ncbi:MAG: hypothetical protein LUQ27_01685 [Methanomassiliicoccales archaeon]|nr:hypothetical protein [Methanomassiliicoccales archaeon]
MTMNAETLKCIDCDLCELACNYRRDKVFTTMRSSIMLHLDDKKNYLGVMVKLPNDELILGRPEGLEISRSGEKQDEDEAGACRSDLFGPFAPNGRDEETIALAYVLGIRPRYAARVGIDKEQVSEIIRACTELEVAPAYLENIARSILG